MILDDGLVRIQHSMDVVAKEVQVKVNALFQ